MGVRLSLNCVNFALIFLVSTLGSFVVEAGAESAGSSGSSSGSSSGHGAWWHDDREYLHLECYIVVVLVWMAMIFDLVHHKLTQFAKESMQSPDEDDVEHMVHRESQVSVWEQLMENTTGELTVLGFLAFVVWACARAGGFGQIAESFRDYSDIQLPPGESDYLHMVEDVHMHIFVTMLVYMSMMALTVRGVAIAQKQWRAANHEVIQAWAHGHLQATNTDCHVVALKLKNYEQLKEHQSKIQSYQWVREQPKSLQAFWHARRLFFITLEQEKNKWKALRRELAPVLGELKRSTISELSAGAPREDLTALLEFWFPFNQYLELQCRMLVDNLTEVKSATWAAISIAHLVKAQLFRELTSDTWVYLWFTLLGVGIMVPSLMTCRLVFARDEESRNDWDGTSSMDSTALAKPGATTAWGPMDAESNRDSGASAMGNKASITQAAGKGLKVMVTEMVNHAKSPWVAALRFLQFGLFTVCLNLVRFVILRHWWEESRLRSSLYACIIALGIPLFGMLLGHLLPRLSVRLARASLMSENNLRWLRVILNDYSTDRHHVQTDLRATMRNSQHLRRQTSGNVEDEDSADLVQRIVTGSDLGPDDKQLHEGTAGSEANTAVCTEHRRKEGADVGPGDAKHGLRMAAYDTEIEEIQSEASRDVSV